MGFKTSTTRINVNFPTISLPLGPNQLVYISVTAAGVDEFIYPHTTMLSHSSLPRAFFVVFFCFSTPKQSSPSSSFGRSFGRNDKQSVRCQTDEWRRCVHFALPWRFFHLQYRAGGNKNQSKKKPSLRFRPPSALSAVLLLQNGGVNPSANAKR